MSQKHASPSRRDFLKTTSAVAAGAVLGGLAMPRSVHAAGSDVLRVGLIGCGGRGSGAAVNALSADPNCKLVAMADAFEDRLKSSLNQLKLNKPRQVAVDREHCFVGFEAADKLIASGVDVVILTEPPHFRPQHLKAAVAAGKHVFFEKPVAVDAPGVRSVLATAEEAKKKGLNLVCGLCWRYDPGVRETMKRVLNGAIGKILTMQETYLTGAVWQRPRQPDWTEMIYQFATGTTSVGSPAISTPSSTFTASTKRPGRWATRRRSGRGGWAAGKSAPIPSSATSSTTTPSSMSTPTANALLVLPSDGWLFQRRFRRLRRRKGPGTLSRQHLIATTKTRSPRASRRTAAFHRGRNPWRYRGPKANMYDVEHKELFAAIRSARR